MDHMERIGFRKQIGSPNGMLHYYWWIVNGKEIYCSLWPTANWMCWSERRDPHWKSL